MREMSYNFPHRRHSFISILIDANTAFSHDDQNSTINISIADSLDFFNIGNGAAAVPTLAGDTGYADNTDACAFATLSTEISTTTYSTPIGRLPTSWRKVLCQECHRDSHDISHHHCIECHFKENGYPSYYHEM
jgi:hypothetical protein